MPWEETDRDTTQPDRMQEIFTPPDTDLLGQEGEDFDELNPTNKSCREMLGKIELRQGIRKKGGTPRR